MSCLDVSPIEIEMAKEVIAPIAGCAAADCVADEDGMIRCAVPGRPEWKLCSVVFSKEGLRRLRDDPDRAVKIEYLQKDIARAARSRSEYRYPHLLGER